MKKIYMRIKFINPSLKSNMKNSVSVLKLKFAIVLFLGMNNLSAQQQGNLHTKIGIGADRFVSGNWHGAFYSPYLSLSRGNNIFTAGPVIQKRSLKVNGARVGYSRILMGGDKFAVDCEGQRVDQNFQLNAYCSVQYVENAQLSYSSVIIEERSNRKMDLNWNQLRMTTAEVCTGFELYYKISDHISWKNYFGACVYYHVTYKEGMYHERIAPVLVLGTGLTLSHF
jgi:hypothetical protein